MPTFLQVIGTYSELFNYINQLNRAPSVQVMAKAVSDAVERLPFAPPDELTIREVTFVGQDFSAISNARHTVHFINCKFFNCKTANNPLLTYHDCTFTNCKIEGILGLFLEHCRFIRCSVMNVNFRNTAFVSCSQENTPNLYFVSLITDGAMCTGWLEENKQLRINVYNRYALTPREFWHRFCETASSKYNANAARAALHALKQLSNKWA